MSYGSEVGPGHGRLRGVPGMKMEHELRTSFEIPVSLDAVFDFFSEAANLERITPRELNFRIVTPLPIHMERGVVIAYRLRLFGVPFGWTSRITTWDPPHRFVDEQVKGPYAVWVHTHTFERTATGTLVNDSVRYRLPLTPLGDVAHPLVRRQLGRIFAFREQAVRTALVDSEASQAGP